MVTAAELLSVAAFLEGQHAQAFPSFGSERMGAPVMAFCRIDSKTIRLREPVMRPNAVIIQDSTLLDQVELFDGLAADGYVLLNSTRSFEALGLAEFLSKFPPGHCRAVPASEIALRHVGRPLPNAALLGGFAGITGLLKIDSVLAAIEEKFSARIAAANRAAAQEAFEITRVLEEARA